VYRKSPGRAGAGIIGLTFLLLLAGCTPVPPEKVDSPQQAAGSDPTVEVYPTLTPAPAFVTGCTNVKSAAFNIGASVGARICLEGIINKIDISSQDNRASIEFDTNTGNNSGSLYSVTVLVQDVKGFGLDSLNQLVQGERIAVNGVFGTGSSLTYIAAFIIEIKQAGDLIVLG
jgi:hypothetical protein